MTHIDIEGIDGEATVHYRDTVGVISVAACDACGGVLPVDFTPQQARTLANALNELATQAERAERGDKVPYTVLYIAEGMDKPDKVLAPAYDSGRVQ